MEKTLLRGLLLLCCSLFAQGISPRDGEYKRSCNEYLYEGLKSGVYTLDLNDRKPPFQVYCDMTTDGGGWIVFQLRQDGKNNFYRGWNEYEKGFGNLHGEFWLGNDLLHRLTKAGNTVLRVDMTDWEENRRYAQYSSFNVGPASNFYTLSVYGYSGTAGDGLAGNNGHSFTTKDEDHDTDTLNCAYKSTGAWWYGTCPSSNPNGVYHKETSGPFGKGITWETWRGFHYSLKHTEMKLREP